MHQQRNVQQSFSGRGKRAELCHSGKAGSSSTCCSSGVVERGDAGPVAKKSPKNVLSDDVKKFRDKEC